MRSPLAPTIAASLLALSASAAALAQVAASEQDHAAHHPPGASAPAAPQAPQGTPAAGATMQSMRAMHDKMMAAKSPEERQALMADHMKAMQDGMAMMGRMKREKGGMSPQGMGQRMDMMEMMMQMMMDREAARGPAAK